MTKNIIHLFDSGQTESICGLRNQDMGRIVLPSGFEPELKPREGFMIGRYTTGAGSHRIDM